MSEPIQTIEGWYAEHDFRSLDWSLWRRTPYEERREVLHDLQDFMAEWGALEKSGQGSSGVFSVIGHKADVLFLHFRPTLDELGLSEREVNQSRVYDYFKPSWSYLSMVELSQYLAQPSAGQNPEAVAQALERRLKPTLPNARYLCFYPMNKRRLGADNWYMQSAEQRRQLMASHGAIGRSYAGRITQIITGSQGLDDWEWGVTLFADDPLHFKKIVYEMRFDETTARFGEFGPFLIGTRLLPAEIQQFLAV